MFANSLLEVRQWSGRGESKTARFAADDKEKEYKEHTESKVAIPGNVTSRQDLVEAVVVLTWSRWAVSQGGIVAGGGG